ncbi:unnamed protein product [Ambrosiozyma monospora]|uniref:Unnamed protein product n=1 Tax=Ambrosiozyma monospora TaxID=43982 RepID=A0A9W6YWA6_AMBMO|nr:unnamed protein product [Ambrosiozyma monospora]
MATLDFDDYDSILSSLHNGQLQVDQPQLQQQQPLQSNQLQFQNPAIKQEETPLDLSSIYKNGPLAEHLQQQQQQQSQHPLSAQNLAHHRQHGSRFSSISQASHPDSEVNFNDINDAVSSLSSSILSPYSSGSSPDDFFLNGNNTNQQFQDDQDQIHDPHNQAMQNHNAFANVQPHYVPMGESMSTSTVTFNTQYLYDGNNNNNNINNSTTLHNTTLNENNGGVPPLSNSVSTDSTPSTGSTRGQPQQQLQQSIQSSIINPLSRVSSIAEVSEDDSISLKSPATKGKKKSFSSLKAKSKANASANGENSGVHKPGRKIKSSHNLIEKKYRTNINSKIIDLRNCVPALRIVISKNRGHRTSTVNEGSEEQFDDDYEGNGYSDDERKLDGLKPAKKLNKATILSKATEYIRHLEYKNSVLMEENAKLRSIVENTNSSIESMLSNQQQQPQQMKHTAPVYYNHNDSLSPDSNSPFSNSGSGSTHISPRTMMDRSPTSLPMQQPMRSQSLQSPTSQQAQQQQQQQQQTQLPTPQTQQSSLSQKLMMGGMACMIGSTAFDDFNAGSPGSGGHRSGLFSIPVFAFIHLNLLMKRMRMTGR